ncbi:hypothetical protein BDW66DRAFT_158815 [Aspergillus desertorum]
MSYSNNRFMPTEDWSAVRGLQGNLSSFTLMLEHIVIARLSMSRARRLDCNSSNAPGPTTIVEHYPHNEREIPTPDQLRSSCIGTVANITVDNDQEKLGVWTQTQYRGAPGPGRPFCGKFVSFGWISCIGVFIHYYKTRLLRDVGTSAITWITSLEYFMMFSGGPFVGVLFDSFGPHLVLLTGSFLHIFGHFFPIMLTGITQQLDFGRAIRVCAFTSLFLLTISNLTVRSRMKHQRRKPLCHPMDFVRPLREMLFVLASAGTFFFIPGRILPPYIADYLGRFNLDPRHRGMHNPRARPLASSDTNGTAIAFVILYGFAGGSAVLLAPALGAFAGSPGWELNWRFELFCAGSMCAVVVFYGIAKVLVQGGGWWFTVGV